MGSRAEIECPIYTTEPLRRRGVDVPVMSSHPSPEQLCVKLQIFKASVSLDVWLVKRRSWQGPSSSGLNVAHAPSPSPLSYL